MNHDIRERKPKQKKRNSPLRHVRTACRSILSEERQNTLLACIHRDLILDYETK